MVTDVEMMVTITRFCCEACRKKADVKGRDNGKTRPPKTWRWISIHTFRTAIRDPDHHGIYGLVCSPACAATAAARSWALDEDKEPTT